MHPGQGAKCSPPLVENKVATQACPCIKNARRGPWQACPRPRQRTCGSRETHRARPPVWALVLRHLRFRLTNLLIPRRSLKKIFPIKKPMRQAQPAPRPRGRPPGSKNKPKPPELPLPKSRKTIPDRPTDPAYHYGSAPIPKRLRGPQTCPQSQCTKYPSDPRSPRQHPWPRQHPRQHPWPSAQGSTQGTARARGTAEVREPEVRPEPEEAPRPSERAMRMLERQSAYDRLTAGASVLV